MLSFSRNSPASVAYERNEDSGTPRNFAFLLGTFSITAIFPVAAEPVEGRYP
jgi:hypothetical protein